ncbi:uncharacterized protein [Dermacentor andersoni]|uniref:uncharacterized protein n=1 Tax=Dermacentor andersoni TaxID=34620 RepID=UPI003B3B2924
MNEEASAGSTQFAAQLGQMEPFDVSTNDWASYEERLTSFLIVNRVPEGDRVHAFLSIIGPSTYSLLKSLVAPELPSAKSFEVLTKMLGDHLSPKPSVIGERAKFHRRQQVEGESISDYVAELRKLARTCDFASALDESLRDRFVCGLLREDIQRVLFTEDSKLMFQRAVERAVAMEAATKSNAEARTGVSTPNPMHKVQATSSVQSQTCFRCGSPKHSGKACPHVNDKCYKCNKRGHLQRVCRSTSGQSRGKRPIKDTVKTLSVVSCSEVVAVRGVSAPSIEPIMVPMKVNDVTIPMELDTGAAVTVMPFKQYRQFLSSARLNPTEVKLRTYTGALVIPKGVLQVKVQHGGNTASLPLYVVDQGGPPLLGWEWLQTIRLEWNKIWNVHHLPRSELPFSCRLEERLHALIAKYDSLFQDELGMITEERAELYFKPNQAPKFLKARNVPFELQKAVELELSKMEKMGIITAVATSDYATPVVPVIKKDGGIRLCGDYKVTVNPCLDVTRYPLPKVDDLFAALSGGTHFSKIDLNRAYQQVVMSDASKQYLTLNTHKGLFVVNRLPFGIASAPGIFQKIMETMLKDLKGVCCYLDDILVTGKTLEDHLANLEALLERLQSRGVRVNKEKCSFFQSELHYLGHKISAEGISPLSDKVDALLQAPEPKSKKQLQSLLGVVNYYSKFVPQLATIAQPFFRLLQKKVAWHWDEHARKAFNQVKALLAQPPTLAHYDPERQLRLSCDASQYGVGAVLFHVYDDGRARPIAYASRTLSEAEKKYSQLEKEALAIIFGVKKFHFYLYGRSFTLVTDHKPLQTILGPTTGIPTIAAARLQRWAVTLAAYSYNLIIKKSSENAEADFCSRLPLPDLEAETKETEETFYSLRLNSLPVSSRDIAAATCKDRILCRVKEFTNVGWPASIKDEQLKPFFRRCNELTVHQGCVMLGARVVVPAKLQGFVLDELHDGHPGIDFKHFVQAMGARHVLTAPYHPSSNGLAERFIQTLKNALRKDGTGGTLQDQLLQRPAEDVTPRHGTAGEVATSEFLFYPETAGAPVPSSPQPPMVTPVAQQATPAPAEARRYPM